MVATQLKDNDHHGQIKIHCTANKQLAKARAEAVASLLEKNGIPDWRIRTKAAPSGNQNGQFQSVIFSVGQQPY